MGCASGRVWFVMWRNTPSAIGERPADVVSMVVRWEGKLRSIVQMLPRQTKRTETGFCPSEFVETVMIVWYRME